MFAGCTSLTAAPELPATTLVNYCYYNMFNGCTSLSYIKCFATDISANDCTYGWVEGVSATGTFIKHPSMNNWTTGDNGIPTNWTVRDYSTTSTSLRIWVDDFPEDAGYDEGSAQDKMVAEVGNPGGEGANPYEYLGETIVYNGNTYYLWQAVEGYNIDNSMTRYFATTTIDFNALYSQSLEDDLTNHFTDAIGMFNDSKNMYWAQSIGDDGELYLVKVINNSSGDLRLWFDDFVDGDEYQTMTDRANAWEYHVVDEYINDVVADPETFGSNAYIYTGETMVYNGTTYYLWERDINNGAPSYMLTTTVDFNTLYDN
jgi:hypothetical protein